MQDTPVHRSTAIQFLVILRDASDAEAGERRQAAGPHHRARAATFQARGHLLLGGALLNEAGTAVGSAAFVQFGSREELDEWFNTDPYRLSNVWASMEVYDLRIAAHYGIRPLKEST